MVEKLTLYYIKELHWRDKYDLDGIGSKPLGWFTEVPEKYKIKTDTLSYRITQHDYIKIDDQWYEIKAIKQPPMTKEQIREGLLKIKLKEPLK